jgi:DNA-directed RNA polymerase subunit RPC12/RpoP
MEAPSQQQTHRQFPCKNCGANLQFAPGTRSLVCPYCGTTNEIAAPSDARVEEIDFAQTVNNLAPEELVETLAVRCNTCGAETTLKPNVTAARCPFCGSAIVAQAMSRRLIKPKAVLPFHITHDQAGQLFKDWIASRWFAPNELKKRAERSDINGVYMPCWTYDSDTTTRYTGQRGDDYYVTESYTVRINGRSERRTRQVRKTRWSYASGTVFEHFDDVLVLASHSLPKGYAEALEPWDLKNLVPYQDEYLSGFQAESYQLDLPQGFEVAKTIMADHIAGLVRMDIGGDHQRIDSMDTRYAGVTFKHTLLPVWISAYRFHDKTFRFLVNARTGEVQGERPYSWIKITLLVVTILIVILLIVSMQGQMR